MDIAKEYSCLEQNRRIYHKTLEKDDSFQETLPAYCDDLFRVVKCISHSYITSVDINYNEVKIFGKTQICLTYYDEASNLCYVDFDEDLNISVDVEGLSDGAFAVVNSGDKYCSFRVINQRRIDFHTACSIDLAVYDKASSPCLSSCESSKLKKDTLTTTDIIASSVNKIEFDEEISVPSDSPAIKRVVSSSAYATVTETKIIKDKALIKANVNVCLLYTADGESEQITKINHTFSVSRIVDSMGIDENDLMVANAQVACIYMKLKQNSSQQMSVVEIYGDLSITSLIMRERLQTIISDGYIVNRVCTCQYSPYTFRENGRYINESIQQTLSFDFSNEIKEVKELSLSISNTVIKDGKIIARATAGAICQTDDSLTYLTNSVDIELAGCQLDSGTVYLSIISYDFTLMADGRIDVRLNASLNGYLFNESTMNVLSELDSNDDCVDFPALTVYFGKQNESLWSIAKSFSSDIDMIKEENELIDDVLDSNKILIIPGI